MELHGKNRITLLPRQTRTQLRPGRRGTALLEFVLSIPLLATVIVLTFFFGYALTNQQHVIVATRFVTWEQADAQYSVVSKEVNVTFLDNKSGRVDIASRGGPRETLEDLVDEVYNEYSSSGELIERCMPGRWPEGHRTQIDAFFASSVPAWDRFAGAMSQQHVRDGVQWQRGEVSYLEPVRDEFLYKLDNAIGQMGNSALEGSIRSLYLVTW